MKGIPQVHVPWRPDEVTALRQMRADGATLREIAAKLGRPYRSVENKVRYIGAPIPRDLARQNQIKRLAEVMQRPDVRARLAIASKAAAQRPERRQKSRETLLRTRIWEKSPPPPAGQLETARRCRWAKLYSGMPPHIVAEYRELRAKGIRSPDARAAVLALWHQQLSRALRQIAEVAAANYRAPTAFERQLERVRNGARLVPTFRPGARPVDDRSLIGSSAAMVAFG